MTAIDCTDCYLTIALGDGVKRALVRHFARFLAAQLEESGIVPREEREDRLDREAWRLAARVLGEVEAELAGALDEALLTSDPQRGAENILASVVGAAVDAIERHYIDDALLGFPALCARLAQAGADPADF